MNMLILSDRIMCYKQQKAALKNKSKQEWALQDKRDYNIVPIVIKYNLENQT